MPAPRVANMYRSGRSRPPLPPPPPPSRFESFYDPEAGTSFGAMLFRATNGSLHGTGCIMLFTIMVEFLEYLNGRLTVSTAPQAILLVIFLAIDTLFDCFSVVSIRTPWPGWALLLRLAFGVGYLVIFMTYVGFGHAFVPGYVYWNLAPSYASPVVYLLLWIIGVWDLLHIALQRHRVGYAFRRYMDALSRPNNSPRPPRTINLALPRMKFPWRRRTQPVDEEGGTQILADAQQHQGDTELQDQRQDTKAAVVSTTTSNASSSAAPAAVP